jgi:predicted permease
VTNFVLLLLCFGLGLGAQRLKRLPKDGYKVLNAWVINVSLPALVLKAVHAVDLRAELFIGAACLWLVFVLAAGAGVLAMWRRWESPTVAGAIALSAGLGNTAFVGLPMLDTLGGPEAVQVGTMVDQLGTFGVLSVLAVPFAISVGGGQLAPRAVAGRVLTFAPFVALVLALSMRSLTFPAPLEGLLGRLESMMSPLALASVGWQLKLSALKGQGRRITLGLGYKLLVAPALVFGLLWLGHRHFGLVERVTVAQAAMPPMVTSAVLAADNQLDAPLASGLIAMGLFVSVVSVPIWWFLSGVN